MKTRKILGRATTLLLIVAAFSGCTSSLVAPAPEKIPASAVLQVPASSLPIPIKINLSRLKSIMESGLSAEQESKGLLWVTGKNLEGYGVTVQVGLNRSGAVGLNVENDGRLNWAVPLAINHGVMDYPVTLAYARVSRKFPFEGTMAMRGMTKIGLDKNWNIVSVTDVNRSWTDKLGTVVETPLGAIKVDVSSEAEKQILPKLKEVAKKVDAKIEGAVNMRQVLQTAWQAAFEPVKLNDSAASYLLIEPQYISEPHTFSSDNNLVFTPFIVASIAVRSDIQNNRVTPTPLPENAPQGQQGSANSVLEELNISMPVLLKNEKMKAILAQRVSGKTYEMVDKTEVTITDLNVYSSGRKIILKVVFSAKRPGFSLFSSTDGQLYMEGIPKYNESLSEITAENFDYDAKTKAYLEKENGWLLDDKFVRELKSQIRFDLKEDVENAKKSLQGAIVNRELERGVVLNGSIKQVGASYLYVTEEGLLVQMILQGNASLDVTPADVKSGTEKTE